MNTTDDCVYVCVCVAHRSDIRFVSPHCDLINNNNNSTCNVCIPVGQPVPGHLRQFRIYQFIIQTMETEGASGARSRALILTRSITTAISARLNTYARNCLLSMEWESEKKTEET